MNRGMNIDQLLNEVERQSKAKRDFIGNTAEHIAMVKMPDYPQGVALVLADEGASMLQRFRISEHCHNQIAARLKIPRQYYNRLLADHTDLVLENVNTLFKREPELRMVRTLDGVARAFLSNSYQRLDNNEVLAATLPIMAKQFETRLIGSHVNPDRMRIKCLFTGDEHKVDVGTTRDGSRDTLRAGFEFGNSETGQGSMYLHGFFYRDYCENGCVFGKTDTASLRQIHLGKRLDVSPGLELSDETRRAEDVLRVSAFKDVLRQLSSPEWVQSMGEKIRAARDTATVKHATTAVQAVCKEVGLPQSDADSVLHNLLRDDDLTKWGMVNAVTAVANSKDNFEEASSIESMGGELLALTNAQWNKIASLVPAS